MKKIAITLLFSTAISTSAFAADQGFYTNADYGIYLYSNAPESSSDGIRLGGIRLGGGYHFNPYVGVEAGLSIIKDSTSNNSDFYIYGFPQTTLSASSYQVAVVGTIPVNDQYGMFGKLGWANTSLDYTYSDSATSITGSGSASKTNPMFGIGWGGQSPNQHVNWRVQYENFGKIKMTITFSDQSSKHSVLNDAA
jgi:OmpA-OmpF porin, OOP family